MSWTAKARLSYYIGMPLRLNTWAWKDGMVYRYAIIGINDEYKAKKALISKILGIASYLNGNKPLKKG